MINQTILIKNEEELSQFCQNLAKHLIPGISLLLNGEMGSGKTTFTRYLGYHLGAKGTINSPTYSLIQHYSIPNHPITKLVHMDLYRLNGQSAIDYLDLDQYTSDPSICCVIEWAKNDDALEIENAITLEFSILSDSEREIQIIAPKNSPIFTTCLAT